ncbi:hypothetical protein BBEV_2718 [Salisediminibacterium beveridgei]|uniref:Uncharacterized protein n=1 Tax=Salisediminibacterium beveridgei TaxID=632773 RepID=A0A1D7QYG2_9BACI|nr:hypothetical protein BBEV_2718 [Salisediminibacterium beveridgei]
MTLLILLGVFAMALFFMFKYTMIGSGILGSGLARYNGFRGNQQGITVTCSSCGTKVRMSETVAYCDRCRKYI